MALTPIDITNQEFTVKLRGYDPREVDAFLNRLTQDFDMLYHALDDATQRIMFLEQQLEQFKQKEGALHE